MFKKQIRVALVLPVIGAGMMFGKCKAKSQEIEYNSNIIDENKNTIIFDNFTTKVNSENRLNLVPDCFGTQTCGGIVKVCECNFKKNQKNKIGCAKG